MPLARFNVLQGGQFNFVNNTVSTYKQVNQVEQLELVILIHLRSGFPDEDSAKATG